MHFKTIIIKSLRILVGTVLSLPTFIIFMLMFPVNFPAWLWLEHLYDARFGSGLRPVENPGLVEVRARVISWLACSVVAGIYLLVLQFLHWEYGPAVPHALLPLFALAVGFAAVQVPFLWIEIWIRLDKRLSRYFSSANDITYYLTDARPGEDFHIYTVTRRAPGQPSIKLGFMCPCETGFMQLSIVHANARAVRLEGIFSTRYFKNPPAPPNDDRDYARGILEITYPANSTPQMKILHWLPLVPEEGRKTEITDVFSITAPFYTGSAS